MQLTRDSGQKNREMERREGGGDRRRRRRGRTNRRRTKKGWAKGEAKQRGGRTKKATKATHRRTVEGDGGTRVLEEGRGQGFCHDGRS